MYPESCRFRWLLASRCYLGTMINTPAKISTEPMEPKTDGFQKESPFSRPPFSGSMLTLRGLIDFLDLFCIDLSIQCSQNEQQLLVIKTAPLTSWQTNILYGIAACYFPSQGDCILAMPCVAGRCSFPQPFAAENKSVKFFQKNQIKPHPKIKVFFFLHLIHLWRWQGLWPFGAQCKTWIWWTKIG